MLCPQTNNSAFGNCTARFDCRVSLCTRKRQVRYYEHSTTNLNSLRFLNRTGILAMLCQSLMGMSDDDIVSEYAKSECMRDKDYPSTNDVTVKGKFDRKRFAGSPPQAMLDTLAFIRSKYNSVCPGYLDHIGFDNSWRHRFVACQAKSLPEAKFASKL